MLKLRDYSPALKYGAKIMPEDIAGMIGLPSVGNIFYVDPGKSVSGGGRSQDDAFKTVTEAYNAMEADNDDVCVIAPSSSTGRTSETATLTWAKRRTHIVGNGPLRRGWNRAGIGFSDAVTTPSMTISANNCSFTNFMVYNSNDVNVLVNHTGDYNTFNYVHLAGIANATTGDDTAGRCLVLTGSDDNQFNSCMIGVDSVASSAANAQIEFATGSARNAFKDCVITHWSDNAGSFFVIADSTNDIDRYVLFDHCWFHNPIHSGATNNTVGMNLGADIGGAVFLWDSWITGATDWADDFTLIYGLGGQEQLATQATAGIEKVLA
jgi:hypothetical protein